MLFYQVLQVLLLRKIPTHQIQTTTNSKSLGIGGKSRIGNHPALKVNIAVLVEGLPLIDDVVDSGSDVQRYLHAGVFTLTVVVFALDQVLQAVVGGDNIHLMLYAHSGDFLSHLHLVALGPENFTNKLLKGIARGAHFHDGFFETVTGCCTALVFS